MKKIILILGTILLGVWIVSSLIMSNNGLQGGAQNITTEGVAKIEEIIKK
jgi:hypothetical protein